MAAAGVWIASMGATSNSRPASVARGGSGEIEADHYFTGQRKISRPQNERRPFWFLLERWGERRGFSIDDVGPAERGGPGEKGWGTAKGKIYDHSFSSTVVPPFDFGQCPRYFRCSPPSKFPLWKGP
ncbi:hypothetical protein NL676_016633 [Syzygium grande]|nr:hypothetical protein NL676_016633 [Syzygium grande]